MWSQGWDGNNLMYVLSTIERVASICSTINKRIERTGGTRCWFQSNLYWSLLQDMYEIGTWKTHGCSHDQTKLRSRALRATNARERARETLKWPPNDIYTYCMKGILSPCATPNPKILTDNMATFSTSPRRGPNHKNWVLIQKLPRSILHRTSQPREIPKKMPKPLERKNGKLTLYCELSSSLSSWISPFFVVVKYLASWPLIVAWLTEKSCTAAIVHNKELRVAMEGGPFSVQQTKQSNTARQRSESTGKLRSKPRLQHVHPRRRPHSSGSMKNTLSLLASNF